MGSSSLMRKMNWSQCTHDKINRLRSSVIMGISSKPRTVPQNRQMSARFDSSRRSAGTLSATWLKRGLPDG